MRRPMSLARSGALIGRLGSATRALTAVCLTSALLAGGCATAPVSPSGLAARLRFHSVQLQGASFVHSAYYSLEPAASTLWVFIDGDGRPWINGGREPAQDPTSRNPLALRLAGATGRPALYISRPCYDGHASDAACSVELWTSARYSERVVESMIEALRAFQAQHAFEHLVLVGYSGGGTLAALMAPRLPNVRALVTVAANLDVAAWTAHHGYLPLNESLDPADRDDVLTAPEIHLVGVGDITVPAQLSRRYFERRPRALLWEYEGFDHICCWAQHWPRIVARLEEEMNR
jgi:pimeloyl-ACP methyl ester carboxylesterase